MQARTRRRVANVGWLVVLTGMATAVLASYAPRDELYLGDAGYAPYTPDQVVHFAAAIVVGMVLIVVGSVVALVTSSASPARKVIAGVLVATALSCIAPALVLGYQSYSVFGMIRGNWVVDTSGEKLGWSQNGDLGSLLVLVAPSVLFIAWGVARPFGGLGYLALPVVPLATPITAFALAGMSHLDGRTYVQAGGWFLGLLAAIWLGLALERRWRGAGRVAPAPTVLPSITDTDNDARLVREVTTSPEVLARIAYERPDLRVAVAEHPQAYEELIEWLRQFNEPELRAMLARRRL